MSLRDRVRSALRSAAVLAFTLAFWAALAPVAVGGSSTYVMVAGASMQPSLETGDLVVARQAPRYGVGDIVAYQLPASGRSSTGSATARAATSSSRATTTRGLTPTSQHPKRS